VTPGTFRHWGECPVLTNPDGVCTCHLHMRTYELDAMRTVAETMQDKEMMAATLLASEAGEILGAIHKERWQGHPQNDEKLLRECGDVLWALTVLLRARGFQLEDAARNNIDKRKLRFPEGFEESRSIHRAEHDT
jgi:NTP pyrophosphatase (non-canonical NTP hydrolase)